MSASVHSPLIGNKSALEKLKLFLEDEVKNSKNQKAIDFAEAYLVIEEHLATGIPQKMTMEKFNAAYGHKVHAPQFRKMLESERARRDENGEVIVCSLCGAPQSLIEKDRAIPGATNTVHNN